MIPDKHPVADRFRAAHDQREADALATEVDILTDELVHPPIHVIPECEP